MSPLHRSLLMILAAATALAILLGLLAHGDRHRGVDPLVLYCAASNAAVIERLREDYRQQSGRDLEIHYGPSQALLSTLQIRRAGDLFLPADDSYVRLAAADSLVAASHPVARMRAVVAVRRGNPKNIHSLDDLLRSDVTLVLANPDSAAIGRLTRQALERAGGWSGAARASRAFRATVNEVANDVLVGSADAGIVYDAVLHAYPDLQAVALPELSSARSDVSVAVLTTSRHELAARRFVDFLTAENGGRRRYAEFGFDVRSLQGPKP
ncbi:substrate-binding domain-containing protein [Roseimaritima sediminicola]|uniref:substrate-binding domain-containing protein n=1 Tax=Roseimaritima sediminicola TaxID=2662066 RepID=UPI00129856AB|nr:substrate-binding domain-containing protein [Roseimaritima sediminicola]